MILPYSVAPNDENCADLPLCNQSLTYVISALIYDVDHDYADYM